jgi:hypothetical protein
MKILSGCTRLRFNSHVNHATYAMRHGYDYRFDITPRPLSSVFDHKIHAILDCPIDGDWWFWIDDDAFFTQFDKPLRELDVAFDGDKLLIFPASPVNPLGGWTFLSSGNFFFRSTRETHEFFQRVLTTDLRQVEAWWDAEKYGMFTNGDQDKIVWNLIQGEATRDVHAIVPYETFNTRPYHFSSPTDFFLVHFAVPGISKQDAIKQFQLKFRYEDDSLVPDGQEIDSAAMFLHYRIPEKPRESRFSLRRWLGGN